METATGKTAVGLVPLSSAFQTMGERLTHINLSNNRLAGVQQFMSCLAVSLNYFCTNLLFYHPNYSLKLFLKNKV